MAVRRTSGSEGRGVGSRRRVAVGLAVLALALAPAGCFGPGLPEQLDGRQFLSTSVTESGVERPLVDDTRIRIGFADGRLSASAGCNSMGATYRIDGGRLLIGEAGVTEIGCDPPLQAQDEWLFAFLGSQPAVRPSGVDLELEAAATVVRLLDREVAEPGLTLVGRVWTVDSIITGDAVSSVPEGVVATLAISGENRVAVATGCNQGGGLVEVGEGTLRFSEMILTERACDGPEGEMEAAVLAILEADVTDYSIEASVLTLTVDGRGLGLQAGTP
jgi:heat shock protein HslJ